MILNILTSLKAFCFLILHGACWPLQLKSVTLLFLMSLWFYCYSHSRVGRKTWCSCCWSWQCLWPRWDLPLSICPLRSLCMASASEWGACLIWMWVSGETLTWCSSTYHINTLQQYLRGWIRDKKLSQKSMLILVLWYHKAVLKCQFTCFT